MNMTVHNNNHQAVENSKLPANKSNAFIEANTKPITYEEIRDKHIIPVFVKDNEPTISQTEFIDVVNEAANEHFGEKAISPIVRVSHAIKGRIPEARNKPAKDLLEHEKTIYYERMAFMMELNTVQQNIDGSKLKLTVGGVKAYNQDKLYNAKGVDEHFKVFVGFKNTVCTNLCVWTDGMSTDIKARSIDELYLNISRLIREYDAVNHISEMEQFYRYSLSERQFAQLIGKCRLYHYLSSSTKNALPPLIMNDTQIGNVAEHYYKDYHYHRNDDGSISLWSLYNLFTGANKSSYIDTFLERGANAHQIINQLSKALEQGTDNWFLN